MTLNELLSAMADSTYVRVLLDKHMDSPVSIFGTAKTIYESYELHIDKYSVKVAYVEEGDLIVEVYKEE
jgi:hypothetical protein